MSATLFETRPTGLTAAEVADRVAHGHVNRVRRSDRAEYTDIVTRNVFTLFNALVVPAAIALFGLRDYRAAFAVSGGSFDDDPRPPVFASRRVTVPDAALTT